MLDEVTALGSREANVDRIDEALVIFQVEAEDLFRKLVWAQPSLGRYLG
jgi:hypothetical protein